MACTESSEGCIVFVKLVKYLIFNPEFLYQRGKSRKLTFLYIFLVQYEKQRKKQQIDELDSIVRLKRAEAEMFQFKSDEARREAEGLQRIVSAKAEKVEEEYASR